MAGDDEVAPNVYCDNKVRRYKTETQRNVWGSSSNRSVNKDWSTFHTF